MGYSDLAAATGATQAHIRAEVSRRPREFTLVNGMADLVNRDGGNETMDEI
jgi:hypothetical protein